MGVPRALLTPLLVVMLALGLGCTSPGGQAEPTAQRIPTRSAAASSPTAGLESAAAKNDLPKDRAYQQIEQTVARIRGLQPQREVELGFKDQAALQQYFQEAFDREYTLVERQRDQKLLALLGLVPQDQELTGLLLRLLSDEVAGFYDHDQGRMFIIADDTSPTVSARVTFAHEFVHALQDQHFRLGELDPPDSDDDDRSIAVQALVEGDATLVTLMFVRNDLTSEERRAYLNAQLGRGASPIDSAPLVLREELLFPYSDGLRFVEELHRRGGFRAVDAAFRDPPQSTEQVLHVEKYRAREAPVAVTLPDLSMTLGPEWRQTAVNKLGELDLRILVNQHADRSVAERAAAGWGGDRYAILEDEQGRSAVVMKTIWDSAEDSREFFDSYAESLRRRFSSDLRVVVDETERQVLVGSDAVASVELRNDRVLVVLASDEELLEPLASGLAAHP